MKVSFFKVLCLLLAANLLLACGATPTSIPAQKSFQPGNVPSAPNPILTPGAGENNQEPNPFPTPVPTLETRTYKILPTNPEPQVHIFDYHAVPLGEELPVSINSRQFSIRVNKVFSGDDAARMALANAPEEMQWVIIQLNIKYVSGESDLRLQPLDPEQFSLVSKGQLIPPEPWLTDTPSPRLYDIQLMPGEESPGYLAFQAFKDDQTPLLRLELGQDEFFLRLTDVPMAVPLPDQSIEVDSGIGNQAQPVQIGTAVTLENFGTIYKISVQKVLRGLNAWKKISDEWGVNPEPPPGMEYTLAYISIQVARTASKLSVFESSLFTSSSKRAHFPRPVNFECPLPCFQTASLYPDGNISAWVPVLTYIDDPEPLLVYEERLYFQLAEAAVVPAVFHRQISPNAIQYSNRSTVAKFQELKQAGPVYVVGFTLDDKFLVSGGDDKVIHVWDAATGAEIAALEGHTGSIKSISFSFDGAKMASISTSSEIIVWDIASWQLLVKIPIQGIGLAVKFLPDGSLLSVNIAGEIRIWDLATAKPGIEIPIPRYSGKNCTGSAVYSFDADDEGSVLAAALTCGSCVIWKRSTGEVLFGDSNHYLDTKSRKKPLASTIILSPDGKRAAYGMVYYPAGRLVAMDVIDLERKKVLGSVQPMDPDLFAARIGLNDDLYLAGVANSIFIWPEANAWFNNNLIELSGHPSRVTALQFSNNGEILASGDYSGNILLWRSK